jgi:hypothetical protein
MRSAFFTMTAPRSRERSTLSSLDDLLEQHDVDAATKPNPTAAIRKLSANKDIRIFLTALCKYSKADWASFLRSCRILYGVMQSSLLIKSDSPLIDEITSVPHIAMFFRRLNDEDV